MRKRIFAGIINVIPIIFIAIPIILIIGGMVFTVNKFKEEGDLDLEECQDFCEESNGEFKKYIEGYKAPDQCICKINGEVKNIY